MKFQKKEQKKSFNSYGITLVALVVTIVVLLILAGITIVALTGENSVLKKANRAERENNLASIKEEIVLVYNKVKADIILNGGGDINKKAEALQNELRKQDEEATVIVVIKDLLVSYQGYEVIIYEDERIEIEDPSLGDKPTIVIKILTTAADVQLVEIQVEASTTDGDIQSIEALNGAVEKEGVNNTNSKKIFTVDKNGVYYFRVKGTNGRIAIKQTEEITNIIVLNDLLTEIGKIQEGGVQTVKVTAKTSSGSVEKKNYSLNVIMHKGDLILDGQSEAAGVKPTSRIYEFGSQADVGTASANAKNTVVLKIEGDLTINSGVTLTSVKSSGGYGGPKGLIVYCTGTLTNNGTINMTARGGKAAGENVYLWKNSNNSYEYIPAGGGTGGAEVFYKNGIAGSAGSGRGTGGGGSGGGHWSGRTQGSYSGAGGKGTSYSGGAGGGGVNITTGGQTQHGNPRKQCRRCRR